MGLVGTAFGLGLILGPVIGGVLAGPNGTFLWPGLFAAAMSLVSVGLAGWLLPADRPNAELTKKARKVSGSESMLAFIQRRHALLLTIQYTLHTGAVSAAIYLSPLWLAAYLGWGVGLPSLVLVSLLTKHSEGENLDLFRRPNSRS